jgi:hypothetical protein
MEESVTCEGKKHASIQKGFTERGSKGVTQYVASSHILALSMYNDPSPPHYSWPNPIVSSTAIVSFCCNVSMDL